MLKFSLAGLTYFFIINFTYSQNYTISGYVREAGSKELLIGVNVYAPSIKSGTVTNTYGFYSLTLPAQDSLVLVYSFVGFKPVEKRITLNQQHSINIDLDHYEFKEVEIVGERTGKVSETAQMSTIDIPIQNIKDIPALLGEKDVFKVIQLLPGVQKGTEGTSGIYVRGGGPDQNLIILDDATVYNATHLFGFFSLFNGDALKSVELMKGGFPARYGGRLSSVIEMNMKEGNKEKFKGEGGIGLIASRFTLEGPLIKNKSSFLISGRRTYADILARPFMRRTIFGYYFYDLNAKVNYEVSDKDRLYLSGYFGKDKFYVKENVNYHSSSGSKQGYNRVSMGWGNITSTLRWNHLFSNKVFSNTSFVFSDYKFLIGNESEFNTEKYLLRYFSGIKDLTLKSDVDYYLSAKHHLRGGIALTYHRFYPSALVEKNFDGGENVSNIVINKSLENGVYIEDNFNISPKWKLNSGIRLSHFLSESKNYLNPEPRISLAYNVKPDLSLKASFASMNQYVHLISNTGLGLPTDLWVSATKRIAPQRSQQFAAGIAKDFLDRNFALTVEGFYKKMDHVLGYKPGASFLLLEDVEDPQRFNWEKNVTSGQGWSRGAELLFQRKFGRLTGWVGYTLSWVQMQFDSINNGEKFYAKYDRRHDVSVVGIYKAREATTERGGITLSATWVYGTGNALTLPIAQFQPPLHIPGTTEQKPNFNMVPWNAEDYSPFNGFRMEPYHRFDIGIQFHKKLKRIERTWDLSVYNAYNRKNPFFYFAEYDKQQARTILKKASIFPIIPSITYNFKF